MRATRQWRLPQLASSELHACVTTTQARLAISREIMAYGRVLDARMRARIDGSAHLDEDPQPNIGSMPSSDMR